MADAGRLGPGPDRRNVRGSSRARRRGRGAGAAGWHHRDPVKLHYVPPGELERIRALEPARPRVAALAHACRINTLYMIMRAGSGHIGTSFSAMELLAWLHAEALDVGDRCFSSKGHDAPGTYAVLIALGKLPFAGNHALRRLGGMPGHPDIVATPGMVTNTGSLGMGISKARGFVLADR